MTRIFLWVMSAFALVGVCVVFGFFIWFIGKDEENNHTQHLNSKNCANDT
jgi:hypothetical protein